MHFDHVDEFRSRLFEHVAVAGHVHVADNDHVNLDDHEGGG